MALLKKLKEEAKALKIPNYWSYGEKKLEELIAAKKPKNTPAKPKAAKKSAPVKPKVSKPATKAPVKPAVKAKSSNPKPPAPLKNNKSEILKHITAINKLIAAERKLIKGPKSAQHYFMLDRSLVSLKDVTNYLAKIQ